MTTLSELIRGKRKVATVATVATHEQAKARTVASVASVAVANTGYTARAASVASVASVAVANPSQGQTAPLPEADAGEARSVWWRIHFANREPLEVAYTPPTTRGEVLAAWPDATKVEPFDPTAAPPVVPVTLEQEKMIRRWLSLIGETNQDLIDKVIDRCRRDVDARDYFMSAASVANVSQRPRET